MMEKFKFILLASTILVSACGGGGGGSTSRSTGQSTYTYPEGTGTVIPVDFSGDASLDARGLDRAAMAPIDPVTLLADGTVEPNSPTLTDDIIAALENDDDVNSSGASFTIVTPNINPLVPPTVDQVTLSSPIITTNAHKVWAKGFTGKGIVVGVTDGGINFNHTDLAGKNAGAVSGPKNEIAHGTAVASIIAGNKDGDGVTGIAPDATLVDHPILGHPNTDRELADGYAKMVDDYGVRIINNSWGFGDPEDFYDSDLGRTTLVPYVDPYLIDKVAETMGKGTVYVFAAGNEYHNTETGDASKNITTPLANLVHDFPDFEGYVVNVVALDELTEEDSSGDFVGTGSYQIAEYSNGCGASMNWCIGAPGTMSAADSNNTSGGVDGDFSGTSAAAPVISGSLALLMQAFPDLTTPSIVDALFNGATDMGATGIDEVYGHGMVNVEASLNSVSSSKVASSTGGKTALSANKSVVSKPVAASMRMALSGMNIVNDEGHSYEVVPNRFVDEATRTLSMAGKTGLDYMPETHQDLSSFNNFSSARVSFQSSYDELSQEVTNEDVSFEVTSNVSEKTTLKFERGTELGDSLGLLSFRSKVDSENQQQASGLLHPYLAMAKPDLASQVDWRFTPEATIRAGAFTGEAKQVYDFQGAEDQDGYKMSGTYLGFAHSTSLAGLKTDFQLSSGYMQEREGYLGSFGSAGLSFSDKADTGFTGFSAKVGLGENWSLMGQAHLGLSKLDTDKDSLFTSGSSVISQSYAFGVEREKLLSQHDRLSLSIGTPLHVTKGRMVLNVPVGVDADGNIQYREETVDLAEGDIPVELTAQYHMALGQNGQFMLGAQGLRDEAGDDHYGVVTGVKLKF